VVDGGPPLHCTWTILHFSGGPVVTGLSGVVAVSIGRIRVLLV